MEEIDVFWQLPLTLVNYLIGICGGPLLATLLKILIIHISSSSLIQLQNLNLSAIKCLKRDHNIRKVMFGLKLSTLLYEIDTFNPNFQIFKFLFLVLKLFHIGREIDFC